ncbi:hypothetical protein MRX96_021176 [Rhipicephalus microplus]
MELSFSGKRAVVTGASQGIGNVIARELAKHGATVIAIARSADKLKELQKQVPNIVPVCVDLADWNATETAFSTVGPVDLLVNNAAVAILEPVGEIKPESFDISFATNVKAVVNVSQLCAKSMKDRGVGGAIVNVSSQAGIVALANHAIYCASKAALDQLTRVMALELGPYKIRVNSLVPCGPRSPLGRFAEPEEVCDAVLYLLSDRSSMITGTVLPIDGGYTAC